MMDVELQRVDMRLQPAEAVAEDAWRSCAYLVNEPAEAGPLGHPCGDPIAQPRDGGRRSEQRAGLAGVEVRYEAVGVPSGAQRRCVRAYLLERVADQAPLDLRDLRGHRSLVDVLMRCAEFAHRLPAYVCAVIGLE